MQTVAPAPESTGFSGWLRRAEAWLDDRGKGAWIAAMVVSFVFFWPLGLAILAYMIWSKKMDCSSKRSTYANATGRMSRQAFNKSSGNAAFDAYKADTLRRLEQEQDNFEAFLQRLRDARDKAEFDQFMDERASAAATEDEEDTGAPGGAYNPGATGGPKPREM